MHERLITKRQRDKRGAEQKARDVEAWLLIGVIFIGTLLAVWLPTQQQTDVLGQLFLHDVAGCLAQSLGA